MDLQKLLPEVFKIFEQAGQVVLAIRDSKADLGEVTKNEDGYESVFTIADLASDKILYDGLSALTPDIPVISEENVYDEIKRNPSRDLTQGYFWIIDPIDGTNHFRKGQDTWAILGALIHNRSPVLALVFRPALGQGYYAVKGQGAFKFAGHLSNAEQISVRRKDIHDGIELGFEIGYFDPERILGQFGETPILNLKDVQQDIKNGYAELGAYICCRIAEGKMDFCAFPMDKSAAGEWDAAPIALILEEAGGCFRDLNDQPIPFGTPDKKIEPIVAYADPELFNLYRERLFASYRYENRVFIKNEG